MGGLSPHPFQGLNMSISRGDSKANVRANRQLFLGELGVTEAQLAEPRQVSRDGIEIVDTPGEYVDRDALITTRRGVYLRVLTADCAPILIWSLNEPIVAAVHSGWQGSELDILGKTLKLIHVEYGAEYNSLCMVIGPGLTQENFEVGPEFVEKFPLEFLQPLHGSSRFLFNNNDYLRDTAIQLGLPAKQIEILPFCSYRDHELFFSHRRDGGTTGRMMSIIGINK
ncbi:MAG: polyphenol oxidase family protein [Candidatus Marinimicrobia bacterium]|nr:polyphenol oxidase family protein [Candidatus Neomarinimicrobiota bacterium]